MYGINMDDAITTTPQMQADNLIAAEIGRQDRMWGDTNDRADISQGQLLQAGVAQLDFIYLATRQGHIWTREEALKLAEQAVFPKDWGGFRDYGSDVANLVVAAAYIRQEIVRRIRNGESTFRSSRNVETQPYAESCKPNVIEP
ncbi:hypothetical protein JQ593_22635 [Bradyrhizobium viridifuturi]|jgi:hypothetical protein|nr:hypothetical protein [Bradyrhizobium viridifuturi]MCA3704596.1 hypothetical protein [Methylobacterium sp.]OYU58621.1 MAG: hypothetical protein CFE30_30115 [Bradyrhizobium sp. PARBB1]PCL30585.1 hypothetical protein CPZ06_10130 [Lactobacillus acidophilus]RRB67357.1 hypothetical protein EIA19_23135 [Escherichia coli]DAR98597.1 MAG TPA: hypothetical protein [Caudoviricetes sp.]